MIFKKKNNNSFFDGIQSLSNKITNKRNQLDLNQYKHKQISYNEIRSIYKSGLGSKIVRLKSGYALNKTINFQTEHDENYYNKNLRKEVKRACKFMIGFGRGVIINYYNNDRLDQPLRIDENRALKVRAYSGDEITVNYIDRDFHSNNYNKPKSYFIKGYEIHSSRVIDFTYVEPPEEDLSCYDYGGISEFELIYKQIIADGIVERASSNIVEKNASIFYKVFGFKNLLQTKQESSLLEYFETVEDLRSNNGSSILDSEDNIEIHTQPLSNLKEISDQTLRRLAMVTGIPMPILIGENVKGLNSTGDNERLIFQDTIETIQSEYILEPLQSLLNLHKLGEINFKENQGDSPQAKAAYENTIINNAILLYNMNEDHNQYLIDHDIIKKDDFIELLTQDNESNQQDLPIDVLNEEVN